MRIVSLLPAATDMIFALGRADQLVGVTHDCDAEALRPDVPRLTRSVIPLGTSSAEIDRMVASRISKGLPLTLLDESLLRSLEPDLVLTQSLCAVCALTPHQLRHARQSVSASVSWIEFSPLCWSDILQDMVRLGRSIGCEERAVLVTEQLRRRISQWKERAESYARRSCVVLEWLDPFYSVGHWTPELLSSIGLEEILGRAGEHSRPLAWTQLQRADPDVLLIACCGRSENESQLEFERLQSVFPWGELRAIREERVWVLDGHRGFSRPGPRLVDVIESLHIRLTTTRSEGS